ncbi:acyl-CoA dehydrogenase domain protein [Haloterrigena turkmenica DSM 5511]|uniref:Acyl-CoA dehydrogenase domain protein n=1 Tax=Haloterrigena turkmenica (strain ATCC 51198 / DSM 5511 / JCM 9101 / NCIMB 13204 / VKM B-1734 / 4k) TaxID=543526 RepID=D2RYD7_HALTV|nr:acyl-CoA dehydrogenase family protein [Haloterrigena turkmenica]ADB59838.1 acyl-CoA dehydrogenase domain protein [Haloterrigena turkmenica DSM 5511]
MDYADSDRAQELADRAHELMEEVVLPLERERAGGMAVSSGTIADLREAAREYDIYAPQIAAEYGGMGESFRDVLPVFEEAGRSLLGAAAMRVDAPDEGNMHLLELAGDEVQKETYLEPLVEGEIASGFSMTEPLDGAGSDPKMIRTTAEKNAAEGASGDPRETTASRDGDEWVIDGHKWWTSNGVEADVLIVLARTDPDAHPYEGCSLFLVPADADGVDIVRDVPHMGGGTRGASHAEIVYENVRVPEEHLLGNLNEGFSHAQARLGPARLTHCMRFSGMAQRALEIAKAYLSEREGFGSTLSDKQSLRHRIADAEARLHVARTAIRDAADRIEDGDEARIPVSMCKVFTANVTQGAIDLAVQCCGANGIGKDLPLADFYEAVRKFRIIDGADEVHRRIIARDAFADVNREELEPLTRFGEPNTRRGSGH